MIERFDLAGMEQRLRQHVAALAAVPRPPGSAAHLQAQDYMREHLARAGFTVEADAYGADSAVLGLNLLTARWPRQQQGPDSECRGEWLDGQRRGRYKRSS